MVKMLTLLKTTLGKAKGLYSSVWAPVGAIQVTSALVMILMLMLVGGIIFGLSGITPDQIENFVINMTVGGQVDPKFVGSIVIGAVILMIVLMVVGSLGQIASWRVIQAKEADSQAKVRPFHGFFVSSWADLWKYLGLLVKMGWYMLWRVLVASLIMGLLSVLLVNVLGEANPNLEFIMAGGMALFMIVIFYFVAIIMPWQPAFFMDNNGAKLGTEKAKAGMKDNRFKKVITILVVLFFVTIFGSIIGTLAENTGNAGIVIMGVYQLVTLLFITPFVYSFLWVFTRQILSGESTEKAI